MDRKAMVFVAEAGTMKVAQEMLNETLDDLGTNNEIDFITPPLWSWPDPSGLGCLSVSVVFSPRA